MPVAQAAARELLRTGQHGSLINIAPIPGLRVRAELASSAATKAAVVQLTRALALKWAKHGIRINALASGCFETDIKRDFLQSDAGRARGVRMPQAGVAISGGINLRSAVDCLDVGGA